MTNNGRIARASNFRRIGVTLALLLLSSSSTSWAQERRPLTLEDYYRFENVGNPVISPDGRQIAFVRSLILEDENRRHSEIWLV